MNSPLEVMKAIVENGGPIEAGVSDDEENWNPAIVQGVIIDNITLPFRCTTQYDTEIGFHFCSLTDPTKQYRPIPTEWTHDWARWRVVNERGQLIEFSEKPVLLYNRWFSRYGKDSFISPGHGPSNWENSLEERPRKTRLMTAREFAKFVQGVPVEVRLFY